jgi:hypothetical protein
LTTTTTKINTMADRCIKTKLDIIQDIIKTLEKSFNYKIKYSVETSIQIANNE